MWGRNEPNLLERLIALLKSNISGEKTDVYPGERRMLHEILEDDESIEYWMGGRWGPADEFDTIAEAVTRAAVRTAFGAALGNPVFNAVRTHASSAQDGSGDVRSLSPKAGEGPVAIREGPVAIKEAIDPCQGRPGFVPLGSRCDQPQRQSRRRLWQQRYCDRRMTGSDVGKGIK